MELEEIAKQFVDAAIQVHHSVDNFLWALQRFYERKEERYLEFIWQSIRLVHDIGDTRKAPYSI